MYARPSVHTSSCKPKLNVSLFWRESVRPPTSCEAETTKESIKTKTESGKFFCVRVVLKGQCPDYAHARAPSDFSSKDNRTVKLTRQDFLPDRTADRDLLFIFSSNILDLRRSLSSYIKIWLAVRRLIAILSLTGPKISFRSL